MAAEQVPLLAHPGEEPAAAGAPSVVVLRVAYSVAEEQAAERAHLVVARREAYSAGRLAVEGARLVAEELAAVQAPSVVGYLAALQPQAH